MRATLAIDDDVLLAAKALAEHQHRSVGEVISDLARRAMRLPQNGGQRNGIPLLSLRPLEPLIGPELVNGLRDELP